MLHETIFYDISGKHKLWMNFGRMDFWSFPDKDLISLVYFVEDIAGLRFTGNEIKMVIYPGLHPDTWLTLFYYYPVFLASKKHGCFTITRYILQPNTWSTLFYHYPVFFASKIHGQRCFNITRYFLHPKYTINAVLPLPGISCIQNTWSTLFYHCPVFLASNIHGKHCFTITRYFLH